MLLLALCLSVSIGYGALFYGFGVLVSGPAAGGEFSRGLLSAAYGGAVLTGGAVALPIGRRADRHGVRRLIAAGGLLGAAGLLAFAAARQPWQVLAVWWAVLGPASALLFYEPAYVAVRQAFPPADRARAIAALTLAAGLSGPVFTPATGALVESLGWRDATRVLALAVAAVAPIALAGLARAPACADGAGRGDAGGVGAGKAGETGEAGPPAARAGGLALLRRPRLMLFTAGAVLAYGAVEALVVHRIARFQDLGFTLAVVAFWAGLSGLITLPGRFLLPLLAPRLRPTMLLTLVLGGLALSAALMISGGAYWQMAGSFVVFGLVFGAAMPLRALVMDRWLGPGVFGAAMGAQAALIAGGRAVVPALTGGLHDLTGGYGLAMLLLTALLVCAAVLVARSERAAA